jgi:hypothetical protein
MLEETLVLPLVHSNGTSRSELVQLRTELVGTLLAAEERLRAMAPHERDYYLESGRFHKAVAQHQRRVTSLHKLLKEIEEEIAALNGLS